jgi:hypothetical protein
MGPDLTGPALVAAVSNAGGLGILQAQFCPPPLLRKEIHRVRALTNKPFGVNLLLHFPIDDQVAVCLEERVPVLSLFWGDATPYVDRAHGAGVKVFHQVGSVSDAQRAAAGVDVIVAQGVEAGGHVAGEVSTLALEKTVTSSPVNRTRKREERGTCPKGSVRFRRVKAPARTDPRRANATSEAHRRRRHRRPVVSLFLPLHIVARRTASNFTAGQHGSLTAAPRGYRLGREEDHRMSRLQAKPITNWCTQARPSAGGVESTS